MGSAAALGMGEVGGGGGGGGGGTGRAGSSAAASPARDPRGYLMKSEGVPREAPACAASPPVGPCGHARCAGAACAARAGNEERVGAYRARTASGRPGLDVRYASDVLPPRLCQALVRAARTSLGVSKVAGPGGVDQESPDRTSRTATLYLRARSSHGEVPARQQTAQSHHDRVSGERATAHGSSRATAHGRMSGRKAPASLEEHNHESDEYLLDQARSYILAWMAAFAPASAPDPGRTLAVQIVRYSADSREYYRPHFDTSSKEEYKRRRSHIFYLNDVPAGGCTAFPCSEMDPVGSAAGTVFSAGDWWARLSDTDDVPAFDGVRDGTGRVGDEENESGATDESGVREQSDEEEEGAHEGMEGSNYTSSVTDGLGLAGGRFLWVQPVAGAALSWCNTRELSASERLDPCSLHCSLPVTKGEKWVCTVWN